MNEHDERDNRSTEDDPRITAYAFDELEGEERVRFERLLEGSPALQSEVTSVRGAVVQLQAEMDAEPGLSLTAEQRALIESRLGASDPASVLIESKTGAASSRGVWWAIGTTALAACLGLIFVLPMFMQKGPEDGSFAIGDSRKDSLTEAIEAEASLLQDARQNLEIRSADSVVADESISVLSDELDDVGLRSSPGDAQATANSPSSEPPLSTTSVGGRIAGGSESVDGGGFRGGGAASESSPAAEVNGRARRDRVGESQPASPAQPPGGGGERRERELAPSDLKREPSKEVPAYDERVDGFLDELRDGSDALDNEAYEKITENSFLSPADEDHRESTFAIDVDTASYANIRRFLNSGQLPPPDAVRIEEMINYFDYAYEAPLPDADHPFSTHIEVGACPWTPEHRLVRIGLKGLEIDPDNRVGTNLVFLIDVSGSMKDRNKLPLVRESLHLLVDELTEDDRIALVVYAGDAKVVLESTYCNRKDVIHQAVDTLVAGGSTNGGAGIEMAYEIAQRGFIEGGVNRVVLATDGDLNVGVSEDDDLVKLIEAKRETGVFLSVLGFGTGNIKDAKLEKVSNAGNGNYAYIDSLREAQRVLVDRIAGTLITIAKDVKIQVEFNPRLVRSYRLIGYENRSMPNQDFRDPSKDAGEIGSGHTVTALYEVDPLPADQVDDLVLNKPDALAGHMFRCSVRYKQPDGETETELSTLVADSGAPLTEASPDFRFASAVAGFGMLLRGSEHAGETDYPAILQWAEDGLEDGGDVQRAEFIALVRKARELADANGE